MGIKPSPRINFLQKLLWQLGQTLLKYGWIFSQELNILPINAKVAQLAEQYTRNVQVRGSIPRFG